MDGHQEQSECKFCTEKLFLADCHTKKLRLEFQEHFINHMPPEDVENFYWHWEHESG